MRRLFYFFLVVLIAACGENPPPASQEANELVVLTRIGPTSYTPDETSGAIGFDHDLIELFATTLGLKVRFVVAASDADIYQRLINNEAQIAAAWLTPIDKPELRSSTPYFQSSNLLVTHEASLPVSDTDQLAGRTVHALAGSRQALALHEARQKTSGLSIVEQGQRDELDLLEGVATQRFEAALVDSAVFDIAGNYYPELQGSLEIGPAQPIVWLFAANSDPELMIKAEAFLTGIEKNGTMAHLRDRYFGHIERLRQADSVRFIELCTQYLAAIPGNVSGRSGKHRYRLAFAGGTGLPGIAMGSAGHQSDQRTRHDDADGRHRRSPACKQPA